MTTLAQVSTPAVLDVLARKYSESRAVVSTRVADYQEELRALRKRHLPGIKQAAAQASQRQAELSAQIELHPDCFVKPRTMTLHGIKLGFQKGKGRLVVDDNEATVARIEKHFGEDALLYLVVTKKPKASALIELDAGTLKKLGVTVTDTGDSVVIKSADGEVEKLVAQMLEEGATDAA